MAVTITGIRKRFTDDASLSEGKATENQIFQLAVTETGATPMEVAAASGTVDGVIYPAYGDAHSIYGDLFVVSKTAKRETADNGKPAPNLWECRVVYSVPPQGVSGNTEFSTNVRIRVSGVEETVYTQLAKDTDSTPIRNAVGDLYPDPIEASEYDEAISIEFDTLNLDMDGIALARGKINDGVVTMNVPQGQLYFGRTFPKHTLRLKSIDYSTALGIGPSIHVWHVSLLLLYRVDGWDVRLPQKGYRWYTAAGGSTKTKWNDNAEYLAADGSKLAAGAAIVKTDPIQRYTEGNLTTLLQGI